MKNILLISLICMFAVSCNKSADCYSCDPNVDTFVKQNEAALRGMAVADLAVYNLAVQRAAFEMYDARKRQEIWEEKYAYILNNNPNGYSTEELTAVRELSDHVTEKGVDKTEDAFINQWITRTREDFLWKDDRYRFLIMSLDVDEDNYRKSYGSRESSGMGFIFCECNLKNDGILIKDCSPSYTDGECHVSKTCKVTQYRCGKFFGESCDGECRLIGEDRFENPKK